MRYIGNKTPILASIEQAVFDAGVRGGTFLDIFTGTTSVARHFKRLGFRVVANDIMASAHTFARAYIAADGAPSFSALAGEVSGVPGRTARAALAAVCRHLSSDAVPPVEGLIVRAFSPGGPRGRRFFTEAVAARIDGVLARLAEWRQAGALAEGEHALLLAALIDAADRRANISGTYGAFLKTWQPNALQPFVLDPPEPTPGPPGEAHREDAFDLVPRIVCDVLYIDPPYNRRQYPANYHVLEVIARAHEIEDPRAFEESLAGVTGLPPYPRSPFCVERPGVCREAMERLVLTSRARHVVVSYNEEGILSADEIAAILDRFAGTPGATELRRVPHRRFRSDADRPGQRRYAVLPGKGRDEVDEFLFHAQKGVPAREIEAPRAAPAPAPGRPRVPPGQRVLWSPCAALPPSWPSSS